MNASNLSPNNAPVGIGLLGLGVVGSAVASSILSAEGQRRGLRLCAAVVRDTARQRGIELPDGALSSDPDTVLGSPHVGIVVELMGGEEPALKYISLALSAGRLVALSVGLPACLRVHSLSPTRYDCLSVSHLSKSAASHCDRSPHPHAFLCWCMRFASRTTTTRMSSTSI